MAAGDGILGRLESLAKWRGIIVPIGFVALLAVLIVPLPSFLLDLMISTNVSLSVVILLTVLYMDRPLKFSVFPSLLLGVTMFRLVLNIASTRLILTADAASPAEAMDVAGKVIEAFGNFVAGDSLFVGVVIFLILVAVQFLVITKGATRISEVAARFTLDAMPGKQMAIDADLNAGIISETEARDRREEIRREADFFGAMDGASKFVRGDAIAGIVITGVNIAGGFAVGAIERGWPAAQTAETFSRLTIGDGLTSQIPSFIIAIAAALIVTRSGDKGELGLELTGQVFSQPKGLAITSGFLAVLAFTGLPAVPLLATSLGLGGIAFAMKRATRPPPPPPPAPPPPPPGVESLLKVDLLELEVGQALVPLVGTGDGSDLLERISAVRRQLALDSGFVMPPVRIRDNLQLPPTHYRVRIRGADVARGETRPDQLLAMDPGIATGKLQGEATREPAFGLDAWWITTDMRMRAESMNYTVVDATSVLTTHLTEVVKAHASELLTREEVGNLLEGVKERAPKLVEEALAGSLKLADLQHVLQNLLRERVPIRDMETVLEVLADWGGKTKDVDVLTEYVRNGLRRAICHQYAVDEGEGQLVLSCATVDPAMEDLISSYIDRGSESTTLTMPAGVTNAVAGEINRALEPVVNSGHAPVVLASPTVRAVLFQIMEPRLPGIAVLGYNEVDQNVELNAMGLVRPPSEGAVAQAG
ncbi:MAG: flagellar biosynthesis protein FlhA [Phycisphaera sp.]|nr:MAG: flagellar biosynthesis protein FlhA [Phycisphaera sp.]